MLAALALACAATAAPAQQPKDGSFCGFLTRPSIRPDGGGTNFHVGGQFLCHDGRAKRCESYRWMDKGPCSIHGALPDAYEFEGGTRPDEKEAERGDENPSGPHGDGDAAGRGAPGASGSEGGPGIPGLLGESPDSERLEREREDFERERRRFEAQQLRQSSAGTPSVAGRNDAVERVGAPDAVRCADLARALSQIDGQLRAVAGYSNAFTNDGSTHTDMRGAKAELERARAAAQSERSRLGCQ